jgi:chromosome segregation ATPase
MNGLLDAVRQGVTLDELIEELNEVNEQIRKLRDRRAALDERIKVKAAEEKKRLEDARAEIEAMDADDPEAKADRILESQHGPYSTDGDSHYHV